MPMSLFDKHNKLVLQKKFMNFPPVGHVPGFTQANANVDGTLRSNISSASTQHGMKLFKGKGDFISRIVDIKNGYTHMVSVV